MKNEILLTLVPGSGPHQFGLITLDCLAFLDDSRPENQASFFSIQGQEWLTSSLEILSSNLQLDLNPFELSLFVSCVDCISKFCVASDTDGVLTAIINRYKPMFTTIEQFRSNYLTMSQALFDQLKTKYSDQPELISSILRGTNWGSYF